MCDADKILAFDTPLALLQEEMLDRQVLEAESLASMQTAELPNEHAPMLKVNFPFPEVFKQARQELISMLQ